MQCPDCGGPMWDNRQTKKNPKQPDYKCKDKDGCGKGVWEEKKQNGNAPANGTAAADRAKRPLGRLYFECMKIAKATLEAQTDKGTRPAYMAADLIAATATVFIAAANTGAPLTAPPKKPAPPPPPPKPEPPTRDDDGQGWEDYGPDDLPF